MKFSEKVGNRPMNKRLNFNGDPDTDPDTDPVTDPDPGKTCLGGGMQYPSASNYICVGAQRLCNRRISVSHWANVVRSISVCRMT